MGTIQCRCLGSVIHRRLGRTPERRVESVTALLAARLRQGGLFVFGCFGWVWEWKGETEWVWGDAFLTGKKAADVLHLGKPPLRWRPH